MLANAIFISLFLFAFPNSHAAMLTYTFDDGIKSVETKAHPLLKKYKQKAVIGVVVEKMQSKDPAFLRVKELLNLQKDGWEIASHSLSHKRPIDIPLYISDETLVNWQPVPGFPKLIQSYYRFPLISTLSENEIPLTRVYKIEDTSSHQGSYYFDQEIGQIYVNPRHKNSTNLYQAGSYEREMSSSYQVLVRLGFLVSSYIIPYNYHHDAQLSLVKQHYQLLVGSHGQANDITHFDPSNVDRKIIVSASKADEIINLLRSPQIIDNGWVILCLHGIEDRVGYEPWPLIELEKLAQYLNANHIEVVTLKEGYEIIKKRKHE